MALSPSGSPTTNRKFLYLSFALIITLGVLVYANSLKGQFVWDDEVLVQYNPYIKSWSHLPKIFTSRLGSMAKEAGAFYRPIQTLTYSVDYSFWRLNVFGYHLTNMVLHILTTLSLFLLLQAFFDKAKLSLLAALMFVAHPVHTEAVSYISGRADSLAALFMFLSFYLYLRHAQKKGAFVLGGMAACFLLALLSKEISLVLPALVLFYHYALKKTVDKKAFTFLVLTFIGYALWRGLVIGAGSMAQGDAPGFFQRLPGVFVALTNYFRLLVAPFGLHMEYGGLLFPITEPKALIGIILLVVLLVYVFAKKEQDRFLFFAVGWFFITLLPSSNLLYPINAYMAEHWLYLPSIGFFLLLARFFVGLMECPGKKGVSLAMVVGLLAFYSVLTVRQNTYWSNGINFYKRMLLYAPESSRLYNNLAKAYHDAGKNDELIELLKSAIRLQPDNALAHNNLGNAYKGVGRFDDAIGMYQQAITIDPGHAGPYYNLSTIYSEIEGREEEAIALLRKAIAISPYFSKSYNKLGLIYLKQGETAKATELLERARALNPDDPEVYHSLGYVYFQTGHHQKAQAMYQKALEADPNYAPAYHDLAVIYVSLKEYQLAIRYCDQAVALGYVDPSLLEAVKPYR